MEKWEKANDSMRISNLNFQSPLSLSLLIILRNTLAFMNRILLIFFVFLPFLSQGNMEKGNSDKDSLRVLSTQDDFWELFKEDSLWSFRSKHGYVPMLWNNLKRQATSPLRMTEGQAFFLMGAAGLTASLYYFDGDIDKKFRPLKDENPWLEQTSPHLTELGDYYGYSFLVISGIYSLAAKNHKLLHTTILASQSALSAGIWSRVGKMLTGRMRPGATYGDKEYNSDHWFGPFSEFNSAERGTRGIGAYDAFPSGHTAAAFSIATVFAGRYSDRKAVAWIAYTLATTVAVTRLVEHEHWTSDLIPGALIGYGCGRQVLNNYYRSFPQYKSPKYRRNKGKVSLSIVPMTKYTGLHCRLVF